MQMKELYSHANNFLVEHFNARLKIPIERNGRLTKATGRFVYNKHYRRALRIEVSGHVLDYSDKETIFAILEHELVHYALFEQGKPWKDGDAYFESKLDELGIPSTKLAVKIPYQVYSCNLCGSTTIRAKKLPENRGFWCEGCNTWHDYIGRYVVESSDKAKMSSFTIEERNEYLSKAQRI